MFVSMKDYNALLEYAKTNNLEKYNPLHDVEVIETMEPVKKQKERLMAKMPNQGFRFNPLTSFPRNSPCPCGSTIKFKKCHYDKISLVVESGEQSAEMVKFVNLVKDSLK